MTAMTEEEARGRMFYRGFHIYYDPPPIPTRACDWHFYHDDYDGAPDSNDKRCGVGPSPEACRAEIDEMLLDAECESQNLTAEEQREQAKRCPCRGADDWCGCQNVADRQTLAERRLAGGPSR